MVETLFLLKGPDTRDFMVASAPKCMYPLWLAIGSLESHDRLSN